MSIRRFFALCAFMFLCLNVALAPEPLRAQTETQQVSKPLSNDAPVSPPAASDALERVRVNADVRAPQAQFRSLSAVWQQVNLRAPHDPLPLPTLRRENGSEQGESATGPAPGTTAIAPLSAAPLPSIDFDSTDFDDSGFIPADPIAAAGPHHVVNVTNGRVRFHQKGGTLDFDDSLSGFFSLVNPSFTFDPKVIFDQLEGRFVIVAIDLEDDGAAGDEETSRIFVAVSENADPNGAWFFTAIDSKTNIEGTDHWADYPGLAVDQDAVYITANMFEFSADGFDFGGVRLWVIDKGTSTGGLYESGPASVAVFDPYPGGGIAVTTQPSHMFGSTPIGVGTFLVSYSGLSDGTTEFLQFVRLDDPLTNPTFTQQFIDVGDLEDFSGFPDAPQRDSDLEIETNDRRALHAVWFDDMLWMTATIVPKFGDADAGEATAHWWKLDTSILDNPVVSDQGSIGGEDIATATHTFFPSVAINGAGQAVFGFSASAPTIYVGSYYTTRQLGDPPGSTSGSAALRAGMDYYERTLCGGSNRWGDYSGAAVDPVDGGFWVYNKHAMSRGSGTELCPNSDEDGRWATAYGNFTLTAACPADMFLASETFSTIGVVKEAASAIRTGEAVTVSNVGHVTFRAGDRIVLNSGFSVEKGGVFSAEISDNPCML